MFSLFHWRVRRSLLPVSECNESMLQNRWPWNHLSWFHKPVDSRNHRAKLPGCPGLSWTAESLETISNLIMTTVFANQPLALGKNGCQSQSHNRHFALQAKFKPWRFALKTVTLLSERLFVPFKLISTVKWLNLELSTWLQFCSLCLINLKFCKNVVILSVGDHYYDKKCFLVNVKYEVGEQSSMCSIIIQWFSLCPSTWRRSSPICWFQHAMFWGQRVWLVWCNCSLVLSALHFKLFKWRKKIVNVPESNLKRRRNVAEKLTKSLEKSATLLLLSLLSLFKMW